MANTDNAKSFKIVDPDRWRVEDFPVAASYAGQDGDPGFVDSAGRITATEGESVGIQEGRPKDASKGGKEDVDTTGGETCSADDMVGMYFELGLLFWGQISTGTLTDKYTTRSSGGCFDVGGSAGAYYIDAATSSNDTFKVIKPWVEEDESDISAYGVYQKVMACFNPLKHFLGATA